MGIQRKLALLFSTLFLAPLFSVSIFLDNDSNYPLNAQIIDNLGRHLALIPLKPGQTYIYDISQGAFDPNTNQPYTPLTVIFLCRGARPYDYSPKHKKPNKNEIPNNSEYVNQFGIWTGVARGSYVNALGCPTGAKSCVMKKKQGAKKNLKKSNTTNYGANNWSNDGGQSWTNDAGRGIGSCTDDGRACQGDIEKQDNKRKKSNAPPAKDAFENDGGDSWSNDQEESTDGKKSLPAHQHSRRTPMPFVERPKD
ncbi:hypothetical protein K0U07_04235 [bacterium]|nr:hypothetical protein [bacterium]